MKMYKDRVIINVEFDILDSNKIHSKVSMTYEDIRLLAGGKLLISKGTMIIKKLDDEYIAILSRLNELRKTLEER